MSPLRPAFRAGSVAVVVCLLVVSVVGGAAVPTAAATAGVDAMAGPPDAVADSSHRPTVGATFTFERTTEPGAVVLRLQYDLPSEVTAFRLAFPGLGSQTLAVTSSEGFQRVDETTFGWTRSSSTPSVTLRLTATDDGLTPTTRAVVRDGWAFATVPHTTSDITYTGRRPRLVSTTEVGGEGYGADRMAFMGDYDLVEEAAGDEAVTFVVGNGTTTANVSGAQRYLDRARGRFDFGVERDRFVVFVLPYDGRAPAAGETAVTGEAFGDAVWVTADATALDGPSNAFAHEYVHSRLGNVGNGSAAWLTEATAEYYGSLSTLNVGGSSHAAFLDATRASRFAPNRTAVVLSEPETWRGTLANYEKGAHVLAALDAEIRARTADGRTLYDVFVGSRTFDDYAAFRAAVVETSGDESLGAWLDRYVTTTALPPLPEDSALAVQGADLDPDGDGLTSATEVGRSPATDPFVADTDDDGVADGVEVDIGTDPTVADTDGDSLSDGRERDLGTSPTSVDTDGDGVNDALDTRPLDADVSRAATDEPTAEETETSPAETTIASTRRADADERGPTERAENETEPTGSGVEIPGFGVGVALAALTLWGMLCRRENRESF